MNQTDKSQREIRKIAYALWMEDGQPEGRDREHWEAAKAIWAYRSHNHALPDEDGTETAEPRQQRSRPM